MMVVNIALLERLAQMEGAARNTMLFICLKVKGFLRIFDIYYISISFSV